MILNERGKNMKQITILYRSVLERTGYRKYPYKEIKQYIVIEGKEECYNGYRVKITNRLKVPFETILQTRSKKELTKLINTLSTRQYDESDLRRWLIRRYIKE